MGQARGKAYLDANAGIPLDLEYWSQLLLSESSKKNLLGNASSIHDWGRRARRMVSEARENVARSLGAHPHDLTFVSSGTEANQCVIHTIFQELKPGRNAWAISAVEHDSVRSMVPRAEALGLLPTEIAVDRNGILDLDAFRSVCATGKVGAVSILWVNNETGVIQPLQAIIEIARSHDLLVHVDAAQAWGKIPLHLQDLGAHWVSLSGHKIGGWPGTGLIWKNAKAPLSSLILGKQELALRGGTENVLGIWSLGVRAASIDIPAYSAKMSTLRDRFEECIVREIEDVEINGRESPRVVNTSNVTIRGIDGESLVMALDLEGFGVSAGAACASGAMQPSHVLRAMGRTEKDSLSSLRVSFCPEGTAQARTEEGFEPMSFVMALKGVVGSLRDLKRLKS